MNRIIQIILMVLGVLFLIQLSIMTWFYLADPLGLFNGNTVQVNTIEGSRPTATEQNTKVDTDSKTEVIEAKPSQAQIEAAADLGVVIPNFTTEQLNCFEGIFGKSRVDEIKGGAVPTAMELYKGKSCL